LQWRRRFNDRSGARKQWPKQVAACKRPSYRTHTDGANVSPAHATTTVLFHCHPPCDLKATMCEAGYTPWPVFACVRLNRTGLSAPWWDRPVQVVPGETR